jgi:hypothetical protein
MQSRECLANFCPRTLIPLGHLEGTRLGLLDGDPILKCVDLGEIGRVREIPEDPDQDHHVPGSHRLLRQRVVTGLGHQHLVVLILVDDEQGAVPRAGIGQRHRDRRRQVEHTSRVGGIEVRPHHHAPPDGWKTPAVSDRAEASNSDRATEIAVRLRPSEVLDRDPFSHYLSSCIAELDNLSFSIRIPIIPGASLQQPLDS